MEIKGDTTFGGCTSQAEKWFQFCFGPRRAKKLIFDPCFGPRDPQNRPQEAGRSIFDSEISIPIDLGWFSLKTFVSFENTFPSRFIEKRIYCGTPIRREINFRKMYELYKKSSVLRFLSIYILYLLMVKNLSVI